MKISNAGMFSKSKRVGPRIVNKEVFQIHALSNDNLELGTIVSITFKNAEFFFELKTKEVEGENLKLAFEETGFWVKKLSHVHENLDPRDLIKLDLTLITDSALLTQLAKESRYC